jgi:hypothetical protein
MVVGDRGFAASFAMLALASCVGSSVQERGPFRYYALQSNAEYAQTCAAPARPGLLLIAEEVSLESNLYNALVVINTAPEGNPVVFVQRGCSTELIHSEADAATVLHLEAESRRLRGEYYVGRGIDDGRAYYVRASSGSPSFAAYEPARPADHIGDEELSLLRAWAALVRESVE